MTDMNVVAITGKLIQDSEYSEGNNSHILKMTIIVCKDVRKNGLKTSMAKYFDIVMFGEIADALHRYLVKGKVVAITGELDQYVYDDGQGNQKNKISIIAHRVQMIGGKTDDR